MRRILRLLQQAGTGLVITGLLSVVVMPTARVDAADNPSLTISQLKITSSNGQFVTLYNATDAPLDMSKYQLEYFNSYDLTKATSSRLIALSGTLPPHSFYEVVDDAQLICYQLTVNAQSLGFSSTSGLIEVLGLSQSGPGAAALPVMQDVVAWAKTPTAGAQTLPSSTKAFLQRQPTDKNNHPIVNTPGAGSWLAVQPDQANACAYVTFAAKPESLPTGLSLLPGSEPPVTLISIPEEGSSPPALPAADIGLMAPRITELLPNPEGTGNDSTDEYIELYNPNSLPFDLSGFVLQAGINSVHAYTFPSGTTLASQSFTAFYSEATGITLSNTAGQASLLDPLGNLLSSSDAYKSAKDGQAWSLANGKWVFSVRPTPNEPNIIMQPASKKKNTKKTKGKVLGATTTSKPKHTAAKQTAYSSPDNAQNGSSHYKALALVAGLALLYGAYEYRKDLADYSRKLGRNLGISRANWPTLPWRRGNRAG